MALTLSNNQPDEASAAAAIPEAAEITDEALQDNFWDLVGAEDSDLSRNIQIRAELEIGETSADTEGNRRILVISRNGNGEDRFSLTEDVPRILTPTQRQDVKDICAYFKGPGARVVASPVASTGEVPIERLFDDPSADSNSNGSGRRKPRVEPKEAHATDNLALVAARRAAERVEESGVLEEVLGTFPQASS